MSTVPGHWHFEDVFDALELGCGQLLLDLNLFIRKCDSGSKILLATRDVGSKVEIPAWCRLTGNRLVEAAHPYYLIERKPDRQ